MKKDINNIKTLTLCQNVPCNELENLKILVYENDSLASVMDAYNYGVIQGKRMERAKKAKYRN
ncbi:hypothetical protein SDC9_56973 [bioreactor metagenome]|uniref:Uncharacterized protein n=1 Tax=bioreactor metagenome TaxID=1076179 RepID=A0A644X3B2_9ZZZZ